MEFFYDDYKELILKNNLDYPKNFTPNFLVDTHKYNLLAKEYSQNGLKLSDALNGIKHRTSDKYFRKIFIAQSQAMNYSETSFASYRFLLPNILIDDWLSLVGLHKPNCRDHAIHQPLTSYIVFKLLGGGRSEDSFKINNEPLLDLCLKSILYPAKQNYIYDYAISTCYTKSIDMGVNPDVAYVVWKQLFYETAMKAAIFHDIGYPWQYINRINGSIKNIDFRFDEINTHSAQIITSYSNRLVFAPFFGYQLGSIPPTNWSNQLLNLVSESLTKTHGFPGALSYLYLNDIIRKYPNESKYKSNQFSIEWAALGIMMHDMKSIYWGNNKNFPENKFLRLSFDKDPLSCIICLADLLQEFERPYVRFSQEKISSKLKYEFSCDKSSMEYSNGSLNIFYNFGESSSRAINEYFKKVDEVKYFNPKNGYLDFSSIGINSIKINCQ